MDWPGGSLSFKDAPRTGGVRGDLFALKISCKSTLSRTCNFLCTRSRWLGFLPWHAGNRRCKLRPCTTPNCMVLSCSTF